MQFQYSSEPVEGLPFKVSLIEGQGPVNIRFFVGDELVNTATCPDPPCHEIFFIPIASAGQLLKMIAIDAKGKREEKVLQIQSAKLPPSGVSPLGGPVGPVTDPVKIN